MQVDCTTTSKKVLTDCDRLRQSFPKQSKILGSGDKRISYE